MSTPALPAAVLWDMDGTLVDTEPFWIAAEVALVAEHGGSWNSDDGHALVGHDLRWSAEYLRRRGEVDLPVEAVIDRLLEDVIARIGHRVPWRPGARPLLEDLRARGVPCALVTMSYRRLAAAVLDSLPPGTFDVVVTGDEVALGKPDPEPYLVAAARLGVPPSQCVAIEDSPTGVASARGAGAAVLAVEHLVPIPAGPRTTLLRTLDGVTVSDLARLAIDAQT
jgi:HAD superfamily hydrolase (TIGR01509 family)